MASEKLKIEGVEGFDGEYPFLVESLTMGDLEMIEVEAGVRPNDFDEALEGGSIRLLRVVTTIMLRNAGHPQWRSFGDALKKVPLEGGAPIRVVGAKKEESEPTDPQNGSGEPG